MSFREIPSRRRRNRFRLFVPVVLIGLITVLFFGAAEGRAGEVIYVSPGNGGAADPVFENSKSDSFPDELPDLDGDEIPTYSRDGYGLADPTDVWGGWPGGTGSGTYAHPDRSLFPWLYGEGNKVTVDGVTIPHPTGSGATGTYGYVLGGFWQGTTHGANSNEVNILNGASVGKVYGGAAIGDAIGNIVNVTGGGAGSRQTIANQVTGGMSVQQRDGSGGVVGQEPGYGYKVQGNRVYLVGGEGGVLVTGTVAGGWNASGTGDSEDDDWDNDNVGEVERADTDVIANRVEIGKGVTIGSPATGYPALVYGGYNEGNSKTIGNRVVITGGTITPTNADDTGTNTRARQIAGGYNSIIGTGDKAEVYDNHVEISGGDITILNNANDSSDYVGIYGGRNNGSGASSAVKVHGNTVTVTGGNIFLETGVIAGASGGSAVGGATEVYGNAVSISGDAEIEANVAGGRINDRGFAEGNGVEFLGGTVKGDIYGAYDASDSDEVGEIRENRVILRSGTVEEGSVYGGKADTGDSTGNSVFFYGGTVKNGDVHGGAATTGSVASNVVELFSGSLTGDVYGGSATTGNVTGNAVNLRGMTVDGNLYGGSSDGNSATAKNNAVNLYGGTVRKYVYGNKDSGDWDTGSWKNDGNTLTAFGGVTNVGGIDKFQEAAISGGATVNVTDTAVSSAIFNNIANGGLLSFHNESLNQDVGRINGTYSGNGQIGLEVQFNKGADPAQTDSVVFREAPSSNVVFTFKPASGSEAAPYVDNKPNSLFAKTESGDLVYSTLESGYGIYSYVFRENDIGGGKEYFVGLTAADVPARGNTYADGNATGLSQIALLADTFLQTGLEQAVASICCPNRGFGISASVGYATHRIDTGGGGHADLRGFSGQLALAYNRKGTPVNVGLFGEMFSGSYRTADTASLIQGVVDRNARGRLESYGGGLFFQYRKRLAEAVAKGTPPAWIPGPHLEAVAHAGRGIMDFATTENGSVFRFDDKGTPYYGASLGGGYVIDAFPNILADLYGHGRWVRQGGRSAAGDLGQRIEFDASDSLRLVAGVRVAPGQDGMVRPYAGLAAEWEVLGKSGASIDGIAANRADLSGVSGLIELGVGIRARDCVYIDLKSYGSVGKRRGIGAALEVMYAF